MPNYLMFDIVIKFKSGQSYDHTLPIWVVIYGHKGYTLDIDTQNMVILSKHQEDIRNIRDDITHMTIHYRGSLAHNNESKVKFHEWNTRTYNKSASK